MKNVLLLIGTAMIMTLQTVNAQTKLIGGLYSGMTKSEAKQEFKNNKDTYTNLTLGGTTYRLYTQNNGYDEKGGLETVGCVVKGTAMTGVDEVTSKQILKNFVDFLTNNEYTMKGVSVESSTYEWSGNQTISMISPNKDKIFTLYIFPYGTNFGSTLWISTYTEENTNKGVSLL
jgi:hypothetical protein